MKCWLWAEWLIWRVISFFRIRLRFYMQHTHVLSIIYTCTYQRLKKAAVKLPNMLQSVINANRNENTLDCSLLEAGAHDPQRFRSITSLQPWDKLSVHSRSYPACTGSHKDNRGVTNHIVASRHCFKALSQYYPLTCLLAACWTCRHDNTSQLLAEAC